MKKLLLSLAVLFGLTLVPQTVAAGDTDVTVTTNGSGFSAVSCNPNDQGSLPPQIINTVDIMRCNYIPREISIRQGSTVVWTNQDAVAHTVTGTNFNSGPIGSHNQFTHRFDQAGRFTYVDQRTGASGLVIVTPAQTGTTTVPTSVEVTPAQPTTVPTPSATVVTPPQAPTAVPSAIVVTDPKGALPTVGGADLAAVGWVFLASSIVGAIGFQQYQRRSRAAGLNA